VPIPAPVPNPIPTPAPATLVTPSPWVPPSSPINPAAQEWATLASSNDRNRISAFLQSSGHWNERWICRIFTPR
jgi:hypothetical protein